VVQKGVVGINLYSLCIYALTDSAEDIQATERANDFLFASCTLSCLETTLRAWRRPLVFAFHASPVTNPSLLPVHLTSLDWITTARYTRATILMHQWCPWETKQLTLELCSEVEMPVNFYLYMLQNIYEDCSFAWICLWIFYRNQGWANCHAGTVTVDTIGLNCCRIFYQIPMNIDADIDDCKSSIQQAEWLILKD